MIEVIKKIATIDQVVHVLSFIKLYSMFNYFNTLIFHFTIQYKYQY